MRCVLCTRMFRDSQRGGRDGEREEFQTHSCILRCARERSGRDAPRSMRRAALVARSQLPKTHQRNVRRARQTSGGLLGRRSPRVSSSDSRDCPQARARSGAAHAADAAAPPPLRLLDVGGNFNMTADGLEGLLDGTPPKLSDACAGWGSTDGTRADAAGAANGHSRPRKRARDDGADEDAVPTAAWTSRQRGAALGALGSMRELNVAGLQLGVPDPLLALLAERCARCAHAGAPSSRIRRPSPNPPLLNPYARCHHHSRAVSLRWASVTASTRARRCRRALVRCRICARFACHGCRR